MFYDIFKRLCERENLTPTKASAIIGFSKGSVSYWKKKYLQGIDVKPDSYTAEKIANHFKVSVDYLLGRVDDPIDYDDPELTANAYSDAFRELDNYDTEKAIRVQKATDEDAMRENALRSLRAAFFDGYADDLDPEEIDELWEDARSYAQFKAQQRLNKKKK